MVNDVWDLDWLWCSYWLYILIRSGDYELLLVISFLLVDVSTDGVPADCFISSCCNIGPQTPLDLGQRDAYGLVTSS
ncbi:hypothetical protein Tco_0862311 [Tanacetum coccineum]